MRNCDLLILGGGHVALGLAMARRDCLICEESEYIDAGFSLTLKGFSRGKCVSLSPLALELQDLYQQLGLMNDSRFYCNALEIGAGRFALENQIPVLLKSRVVKLSEEADGVIATLITNSGLETVKARYVADTRPKGEAVALSALFAYTDVKSIQRVQAAFPEGCVEQSYCSQWGALHMPVATGTDYNQALEQMYDSWNLTEKLALIAPRLTYASAQSTPCDMAFADPIAAFEAGYRWGKESF